MKRVLAVIVILCFIFVLVVCILRGADSNFGFGKQAKGSADESVQDEQGAIATDVYLPDEYVSSCSKIAFDTPPYQMLDEGYTVIFNRGDIFYVFCPVYQRKGGMMKEIYEGILSTDEILPALTDRFLIATDWHFKSAKPKNIVVENSEKVTVAGIEMTRFEGYVDCSHEGYQNDYRYIVGYSFFKDDAAAFLAGAVLLRKEEAAFRAEVDDADAHMRGLIDELNLVTEAMVRTLRDDWR